MIKIIQHKGKSKRGVQERSNLWICAGGGHQSNPFKSTWHLTTLCSVVKLAIKLRSMLCSMTSLTKSFTSMSVLECILLCSPRQGGWVMRGSTFLFLLLSPPPPLCNHFFPYHAFSNIPPLLLEAIPHGSIEERGKGERERGPMCLLCQILSTICHHQ